MELCIEYGARIRQPRVAYQITLLFAKTEIIVSFIVFTFRPILCCEADLSTKDLLNRIDFLHYQILDKIM